MPIKQILKRFLAWWQRWLFLIVAGIAGITTLIWAQRAAMEVQDSRKQQEAVVCAALFGVQVPCWILCYFRAERSRRKQHNNQDKRS